MVFKSFAGAVCTCLAFASFSVSAITITLDATHSGWYNNSFSSNGSTSNMFAGEDLGINYRNWIAFDLSGITGDIQSASLNISNDVQNDSGISFTWSEITTSFSELSTFSVDSTQNQIVFNDLADGFIFASGIASGGGVNNYTLNASALLSLNNSSGSWAIGGSTLNDLGRAYGFTNGVGSGDFIQLTLEVTSVPIPTTVWLFGSGLIGLIGIARRKVHV